MVQCPGGLRLQKTEDSSPDPCGRSCGTRRQGQAEPPRPADSPGEEHRTLWSSLGLPTGQRSQSTEQAGGQGESQRAKRDAHCPIGSDTGPGRSQGGRLGLGVRIIGRALSTWRRTQWPPEAREGSPRTGPVSLTSLPLLAGSELSGSGLGAEAARLASRRASDKMGLDVPWDTSSKENWFTGPHRTGEAQAVHVPWVRSAGLTPDVTGTASQCPRAGGAEKLHRPD